MGPMRLTQWPLNLYHSPLRPKGLLSIAFAPRLPALAANPLVPGLLQSLSPSQALIFGQPWCLSVNLSQEPAEAVHGLQAPGRILVRVVAGCCCQPAEGC